MKWTTQELNYLKENYGKIKIDDLVKQYFPTRTKGAVTKKASLLGYTDFTANQKLSQKIYNVNLQYFNKPNIQNSYWAGFLAADGFIDIDTGLLQITLSHKDLSLIQAFVKDISYNGPIIEYMINSNIYNSIKLWGMQKCIQNLNNNWNLPLKNKTESLQPPKFLQEELIYAFIIGLIDGDGWVSKTKNLGICGTYDIVYWVNSVLGSICNNYTKITLNGNSLTNYRCVWGKQDSKLIFQKLNQINISWKLQRKWNRLID